MPAAPLSVPSPAWRDEELVMFEDSVDGFDHWGVSLHNAIVAFGLVGLKADQRDALGALGGRTRACSASMAGSS